MKRTRLNAVSVKRRAQLLEYSKLRREFLKQNRVCQICEKRTSWDVHHKTGRLGRKLLDQTYWMSVCRDCHDLIHRRPAWAREQGYLIR